VLQRSVKRPRLKKTDRVFWVLLSKVWNDWTETLTLVKPDTVGRWHPPSQAAVPVVARDFTVPTVTFNVLFVFVILAHDRRRVVHFNVTDAPTAKWTAQQAVEAFPWDTAPRYLLRDRDGIYGQEFTNRVEHMGRSCSRWSS